MRIRAAVTRGTGVPPTIEDVELAEPGPSEILVRLVACGVAGADRAAMADAATPMPFVAGCEGAGIVERVGADVEAPRPGDAVVLAPARVDRGARQARTPIHDGAGPVHGFLGQSAFATHALCDAAIAVPVADGAPLELLAALGREVLLGAAQAMAHPLSGATLVVTGADAVGLGACMAAAAEGAATIVVADPRESRRALALDLGATIAVPADDGLAAVVRSLVGDGVDFAIETSGAPAALKACEDALSAGGRLAVADESSWLAVDVPALVARVAALVADGRFPLERIITHHPFEAVADALAATDEPKPVLRFSIGGFGDLDRALQAGVAAEAPDEAPIETPAGEAPPPVAPVPVTA